MNTNIKKTLHRKGVSQVIIEPIAIDSHNSVWSSVTNNDPDISSSLRDENAISRTSRSAELGSAHPKEWWWGQSRHTLFTRDICHKWNWVSLPGCFTPMRFTSQYLLNTRMDESFRQFRCFREEKNLLPWPCFVSNP